MMLSLYVQGVIGAESVEPVIFFAGADRFNGVAISAPCCCYIFQAFFYMASAFNPESGVAIRLVGESIKFMRQEHDLASNADNSLQYNIRLMEKKDLDAVVGAERLCYPYPWSAELFRQELDNPLSTIDLLFINEQLAGYLCSWLICGELHIHNVATLPAFRRRGVAARLIRYVIDRCPAAGLEKVLLEVRVGNAGAIALYRSFGFVDVVVRKKYYSDGEDALLMELDIDRSKPIFLSLQGENHDA